MAIPSGPLAIHGGSSSSGQTSHSPSPSHLEVYPYQECWPHLLLPVPAHARPHLLWWMKRHHVLRGKFFGLRQTLARLTTDSSSHAWGAHLTVLHKSPQILHTQGRWNLAQQGLHINAKVLLAVHTALLHWQPLLPSLVIRVEADNKTTVALVHNLGTVHSTQLHQLTVDLLTWCQSQGIHLRASYIPGSLNVLADRLS